MRKWVFPLLIVFAAFFVFSNPALAGTVGRQFVTWVGDLVEAAGEFLDSLFDDTPVQSETGVLEPNVGGSPGGNPPGYPPGDGFDRGTEVYPPDTHGGDRFDTLASFGT